MDRKEFLIKLGIGAAAITFIDTLQSCSKQANNPTPTKLNVNFTFLLTDPNYSALNQSGGYVYSNGVVIAKTSTNSYIAVAQACTHAGCNVIYQLQQNDFYCPCHSSVFNNTGGVVTGPATVALQLFNAAVTGNSVHIYS